MILSPLKLVENDGYRPRLNPGASRVHHFSATSPKMRGPGKFGRRALFPTKNKHLLAIYSIPTRGFTAAVSVFRGTPPAKPFICKSKIRLVRLGDAVFWSWAHPTGEASLLVLAKFKLSPKDITWMSRCSCSQIIHLSFIVTQTLSSVWKTKNPAYVSVSRVMESLFRFFTCLLQVYPNYLQAFAR